MSALQPVGNENQQQQLRQNTGDKAPIPAKGDPLAGSEYQVEDRDVEPGRLYFYKIEAGPFTATRKMLVLR